MQSTRDRVLAILRDPIFDDPDHEPSRQEAFEELSNEDWPGVRDALLAALRAPSLARVWTDAAAGLWSGVCDQRAFDIDYTIAVLQWCIGHSEDLDDNLAWSITCNLKQVGYLSDYNPMSDPGVVAALRRIEAESTA